MSKSTFVHVAEQAALLCTYNNNMHAHIPYVAERHLGANQQLANCISAAAM